MSCFLNAPDYDECDSGEDDCAPGSSCRNSLGSFTCSCEGGTPDLPVEYSGRPCEGNSLRIPCLEYAQVVCSLKDVRPQSASFLNEIGIFLCLGQVSVCTNTCKHAYVPTCMCVHVCNACVHVCVHVCTCLCRPILPHPSSLLGGASSPSASSDALDEKIYTSTQVRPLRC